jgi:hypothetical protein
MEITDCHFPGSLLHPNEFPDAAYLNGDFTATVRSCFRKALNTSTHPQNGIDAKKDIGFWLFAISCWSISGFLIVAATTRYLAAKDAKSNIKRMKKV